MHDRPNPRTVRPLAQVALCAAVLALVAAACGSEVSAPEGEAAAAPPTSVDETTTSASPAPPPPTAPLTGLPVAEEDLARLGRPALVVKIDNEPRARPQTGLVDADLVYEVRVEGITRFAAVFHSQDADPVGPIRSARSSDIDIISNLERPLFAWSGGNPTVGAEVREAAGLGLLWDLSHDVLGGEYRRDGSRPAPHNLYGSTAGFWAHTPADAVAPSPPFAFRAEGDALPASAVDVSGVRVDYGSSNVRTVDFVWDPGLGGWRRFQADSRHGDAESAHVDSLGRQIAPANVVVLFVTYVESVAGGGSPQALTVDSGEALVLTEGQMVPARWERGHRLEPYRLTDPTGAAIGLTPGQTWVLLPSPGGARLLAPDEAADRLAHAR